MEAVTHLSWDEFLRSICQPGQQRVHRIHASPAVDICWDGGENRILLRVETGAGTGVTDGLTNLAAIRTGAGSSMGKNFLEVSTNEERLHRQFYLFCTSVADSILRDGKPAPAAVKGELDCFEELLSPKPLLSLEKQVGLLGELLFLQEITGKGGPGMVNGWVGRFSGEPHDFRLGNHEYEVKTTTGTRRLHTINGEAQLVPSEGRKLFLVSLLLGPGGDGGGFSLAEMADRLKATFSGFPDLARLFSDGLQGRGFSEVEKPQYNRRYVLRRPIGLAPVTRSLPKLTRETISTAAGPDAVRISDISYTLNLEGLVSEDCTSELQSAIRYVKEPE